MTTVLHLAAVTAEGENRYGGGFFSNGRAAALKRDKRLTLARPVGYPEANPVRVSFFAAPTMLTRLVAIRRSNLPASNVIRTIFHGGAPMYVEDLTGRRRCGIATRASVRQLEAPSGGCMPRSAAFPAGALW